MQRRAVIQLLGSGVIAGSTVLSGCARLNKSDSSSTVQMVTKGHQSFFDPIGLFVEPGKTIEFVMDSGNHSATVYHEQYSLAEETRIPADAEPFDSGVLIDQGETFKHTFDTKGTYDYYCIPHKTMGMIGRIVVGEPGGPAKGSMPPDGSLPDSQVIVDKEIIKYKQFKKN